MLHEWQSDYSVFANNPIVFADPSGLDPNPIDPSNGDESSNEDGFKDGRGSFNNPIRIKGTAEVQAEKTNFWGSLYDGIYDRCNQYANAGYQTLTNPNYLPNQLEAAYNDIKKNHEQYIQAIIHPQKTMLNTIAYMCTWDENQWGYFAGGRIADAAVTAPFMVGGIMAQTTNLEVEALFLARNATVEASAIVTTIESEATLAVTEQTAIQATTQSVENAALNKSLYAALMERPAEQYSLLASKSDFYPVMKYGFKEPQGYVWLEQGDVWKFGETVNYDPFTRYTNKWLRDMNLYYKTEFSGSKADAIKVQNNLIRDYLEKFGKLPPGNKKIY